MCFMCISLYFLYAFMVYLRPVSRTHGQFKALFRRNFLIHSFVFPSMFYGSVEVFTEAIRMWFYF
jgi:hypothetical protein